MDVRRGGGTGGGLRFRWRIWQGALVSGLRQQHVEVPLAPRVDDGARLREVPTGLCWSIKEENIGR